jgi:hypothetical protein
MMLPDRHQFDFRCSFHTLPFWSATIREAQLSQVEMATAHGRQGCRKPYYLDNEHRRIHWRNHRKRMSTLLIFPRRVWRLKDEQPCDVSTVAVWRVPGIFFKLPLRSASSGPADRQKAG